jgi:hypothetical protein
MIAAIARIHQQILNKTIVGRVLTVEDQTKPALVIKAIIYNHHHCAPNNKPGIIITSLFMKHTNSTVLGLFQ